MWDEIKGFVGLFILVPLGLGLAYYLIYFAFTGEWPDPPRADCVIEYDGVSNPTRCE